MAEGSSPSYIPDLIKAYPIGKDFQKDLDKAIIAIAIIVCICGLIANSIIFCFLRFRTKKTKIGSYFQNMIVANIFQDIFCLFFHMKLAISINKPVGPSVVLSRLVLMMHILGYNTNFYIFTVLCAARFLFVYFPSWKQQHRPNHFTIIMCAIVWVFSTLVALVENYSCYPRYQISIPNFLIRCRASSLFKIVFELVILLPIMIFCAVALFVRVWKRAPQTLPAGIDISIIAIALLFLLLDAPVRASHDVLPWNRQIKPEVQIRMYMFLESISNSAFPFVFFFVGLWKRQAKEPLFMFLERAFMEEENIRQTIETDEDTDGEQA